MGRRSDDSEALVWLLVIVLGIISIWFYFQVKALAAWLNVDVNTAFSMVGRTVVVTAILVLSMFFGYFRKVLPYVPAAFGIIMCPALTYWSWGFVQSDVPVALNTEPLWYGVALVQFVGVLILGLIGFFIQKWWENN